jgi:hypothetical protein
LSHTVACGSFGSDFGLMLAWSDMAARLAREPGRTLVVCDDPWLFRHLASLPGVEAGRAPPLARLEWKLRLRGFAARGLLALRLMRHALACRRWTAAIPKGAAAILVYGHPSSRADGFDTYFGTLMRELPGLKRLLHTDCPPARAAQLAEDGRTASLHGWGSPIFAALLPFTVWRPRTRSWLVRRAAARENGGGGPAMNRWQMHCQRRFLAAVRPAPICWPWENHAWERDLCRAARAQGIGTVGYQHTVIGPHQINYSTRANLDGIQAIPDVVVADGPAYRREMEDWGVPAQRLVNGGAWRLSGVSGNRFDPAAPVFVPLSAIPAIARLQLDAARLAAASGRRVLVKEHPMYPVAVEELERTELGMPQHERLSAVIYATGTSGLEALLLGLPAFRLLPEDRLAIDVLPAGLRTVPVTLDELLPALDAAEPPPPLAFEDVLSPVDMAVWKSLLKGGNPPSAHIRRETGCEPTP